MLAGNPDTSVRVTVITMASERSMDSAKAMRSGWVVGTEKETPSGRLKATVMLQLVLVAVL